MNSLEMAAEAHSQDFFSIPSVQNLLKDIWIGKIEYEQTYLNEIKVGF
jgi:hypothetical protein